MKYFLVAYCHWEVAHTETAHFVSHNNTLHEHPCMHAVAQIIKLSAGTILADIMQSVETTF